LFRFEEALGGFRDVYRVSIFYRVLRFSNSLPTGSSNHVTSSGRSTPRVSTANHSAAAAAASTASAGSLTNAAAAYNNASSPMTNQSNAAAASPQRDYMHKYHTVRRAGDQSAGPYYASQGKENAAADWSTTDEPLVVCLFVCFFIIIIFVVACGLRVGSSIRLAAAVLPGCLLGFFVLPYRASM